MKKLAVGVTVAAILCGGSTMVLASKLKNTNESNNVKNIRTEIEDYIVSKYGDDWANSLYNKNGDYWDDKLDKELENKFGRKYDDMIENIIDNKENTSGLDDVAVSVQSNDVQSNNVQTNKVESSTVASNNNTENTTNNTTNNSRVSNNANSNTTTVSKKSEIQKYIVNKYGSDWANTLYKNNGKNWDDKLEAELKNKFGYKYEDMIEDIIDAKEDASGLDDDYVQSNTTTSNSSSSNKKPSNSNTNNTNSTTNKRAEIQKYIVNKYGSDWANTLYKNNGKNWDDKLEAELKNKFGYKYEDMIEDIIDAKENASGLDYDDDRYDDDRYDDDRYDDRYDD